MFCLYYSVDLYEEFMLKDVVDEIAVWLHIVFSQAGVKVFIGVTFNLGPDKGQISQTWLIRVITTVGAKQTMINL